MYCKHCGKEVENGARYCPHCGKDLENNDPFADYGTTKTSQNNYRQEEDQPNFGLAVLSFFIPLVGLILFACWNSSYPLKAKSCAKGALIGFIVGIVFSVLCYVFLVVVLKEVIGSTVWSGLSLIA